MIGFDLRGGFYYHALRGVEEFKKRKPEVWVHALQTPPKVRFGRGLLTCSEGMILPMFGIDSFSRWIVPPPPTPLTKEVINVFETVNAKHWKNHALTTRQQPEIGRAHV